jgi:hypothetical protein
MTEDPLGYDTRDPGYLRRMARDALEGRNEAAVEAEIARVEARLGLPPLRRSAWQRMRRWLSHRWWRAIFWIEDRR